MSGDTPSLGALMVMRTSAPGRRRLDPASPAVQGDRIRSAVRGRPRAVGRCGVTALRRIATSSSSADHAGVSHRHGPHPPWAAGRAGWASGPVPRGTRPIRQHAWEPSPGLAPDRRPAISPHTHEPATVPRGTSKGSRPSPAWCRAAIRRQRGRQNGRSVVSRADAKTSIVPATRSSTRVGKWSSRGVPRGTGRPGTRFHVEIERGSLQQAAITSSEIGRDRNSTPRHEAGRADFGWHGSAWRVPRGTGGGRHRVPRGTVIRSLDVGPSQEDQSDRGDVQPRGLGGSRCLRGQRPSTSACSTWNGSGRAARNIPCPLVPRGTPGISHCLDAQRTHRRTSVGDLPRSSTPKDQHVSLLGRFHVERPGIRPRGHAQVCSPSWVSTSAWLRHARSPSVLVDALRRGTKPRWMRSKPA